MKTKTLLFAACLFLCLFSACKDEDTHEEEKEKEEYIKVNAFYAMENDLNKLIPDVNAKVFVYYYTENSVFMDVKYEGDGKFIDRYGEVIIPDQRTTIDQEGTCLLIPTITNVDVTVIVESNYYRGRFGYTYYNKWENFVFTVKFYPETLH